MAEILVVSPTPSHPQNAGNRARIFRLLSVLKEAGHRIHFLFVRQEVGDRDAMAACWDSFHEIDYRMPWIGRWLIHYNTYLSSLPGRPVVPFPVDAWYCGTISRKACEVVARQSVDAVLVEYVFFSKVLEEIQKPVKKVIDTHDIFAGRHKLYVRNGERPAFFYTTTHQENKGLERADVVLAIQEGERSLLARRLATSVVTVGHITPSPCSPASFSRHRPAVLLFVASYNPINVNAYRVFIAEVFPRIQDRFPVVLHLAGNICGQVADHRQVRKLGEVADLAACYRQADVIVNPVRYGSGLKIKTIEAMGYGKPVVTTSSGAEGLEEAVGSGLLVGNTPREFAERVVELLVDPGCYRETCRAAHDFVGAYNEGNRKRLLDVFGTS